MSMPGESVLRVPTYVQGLDNILNGGIPKGSTIVIEGAAGTMKSTLSYAILYQNAIRRGDTVLYMTLEQSRTDLEEQMSELGMPRRGQVDLQDKLAIVDLGELRHFLSGAGESDLSTDWFKSVLRQLRSYKKEFPVGIFVLDSINALLSLHNRENPRVDLFHFMRELKELDMTCLLISEVGKEDNSWFGRSTLDYLVDGIILMEANRVEDIVNMQLGVVKMRKTAHKRSFHPFIVSRGRVEVVGA
jgi:KaiC/GvpD/RAD55 family RecA-like ATPase